MADADSRQQGQAPRTMTLAEARARLRRLFRVRQIVRELEEYGYSTFDPSAGYIAHHAPAPGSSPHEAEIVKRLDLEAKVAAESAALARLSREQQQFAEMRWGQSLPFRVIARELHRGLGRVHALERKTLLAFIAALGCRPVSGGGGANQKSAANSSS